MFPNLEVSNIQDATIAIVYCAENKQLSKSISRELDTRLCKAKRLLPLSARKNFRKTIERDQKKQKKDYEVTKRVLKAF